MKKLLAILLALATVLVLFAACGGGSSEEGTEPAGNTSAYADATEVLSTVWATYEEDNKFPIGGGDSSNLTMDAPGKFDVAMTEELDVTLALPASQHANVEEAASMVNMMNANMFTSAAYRVKADTDVAALAEEYKEGLNTRHWMCGFPEKFVVIKTGDFVITAFGSGDNIETFKAKATAALEGAEIVLEDIIAI